MDAGIVFDTPKESNENNIMFDIRTPSRIYYLKCATENEMNRWVDCLCQVCGLKAQTDDASSTGLLSPNAHLSVLPSASNALTEAHLFQHQDTRAESNISPASISSISGPYIPISECITGRRAISNNSNNQSSNSSMGVSSRLQFQASPNSNRRMSIPTEMAPSAPLGPSSLNPSTSSLATTASSTSTLVADLHQLGSYTGHPNNVSTLPSGGAKPRLDAQQTHDPSRPLRGCSADLTRSRIHTRSSGTTSEESVRSPPLTDGSSSVFTEEEWGANTPHSLGGQAFFPGADGASWDSAGVDAHMTRTHAKDANKSLRGGFGGDPERGAPPRPPKPAHLEVPPQNYINIDTIVRASNSRKNSIVDSSVHKLSTVTSHDGCAASSSDAEPSPLSASSSLTSAITTGYACITDEPYECSRSHPKETVQGSERSRRHGSNNAAPSSVTSDRVFSYDIRDAVTVQSTEQDPRISPALYCNISGVTSKSPAGPPSINRGLKPKISSSDGSSLSGCDSSPCIGPSDASGPPNSAAPLVHRNLKPASTSSKSSDGGYSSGVSASPAAAPEFVLEPAPRSRPKGGSGSGSQARAAPSPTPPSLLEDHASPPLSAQLFRNSVLQDEQVISHNESSMT